MSWTVLTGIGAWPWLSEALALVGDDGWGSGQQVSCLTEESVSGCPGLINSALVTNDSQLALSNQVLVVYFYELSSTIALAYLASRAPQKLKGFVTGWCLCFSFGSMQNTFLQQAARM